MGPNKVIRQSYQCANEQQQSTLIGHVSGTHPTNKNEATAITLLRSHASPRSLSHMCYPVVSPYPCKESRKSSIYRTYTEWD